MTLLGEKIAQLFDTAPEQDPENAFDDDTIAKNEAVDTGIDVDVHPSRMREIDLGDSYKGEVVSRDQLNQWDQDDEEDIDLPSDVEEEDDDEEDVDLDDEEQPARVIPVIDSDEEDLAEEEEAEMNEDEFDTLFEDEVTAGFDDEDGEEQRAYDEAEQNDFNQVKSLMNKQMDKADELRQQAETEDTFKVKAAAKPHSFQLRKANAVAAQTKMYDKAATLRIHLQKPFQIAQKLPRPSVYAAIMSDANGEKPNEKKRKLKEMMDEVSKTSLRLADNIMSLEAKLLDKNDEYPAELRHRKRRRLDVETTESKNDSSANGVDLTFDALWSEMNEDWQDFLPHCNKTMDLWDRKMQLVESYAAKKEKSKQKQNVSVLERIAMIIENPQAILHKMQSVDKLFRMYGDGGSGGESAAKSAGGGEKDDIHKKDERILLGLENGVKGLQFDRYRMEYQVFNDAQFYRRMLKEIIDIGHGVSFQADEVQKKMDQMQQEKQEAKMAFHKAKLRLKYAIRPDMENFMAPIYDHDADFPVEQLYNSLFQ